MLTKGHKIIIIIVIGVLISAGIIYFAFWYQPSAPVEPEVEQMAIQIDGAEIKYVSPDLTQPEIDQTKIKNLAMLFTERFGTYSNHNNTGYLAEVKSMMTPGFYQWVNTTYYKRLVSEYQNGGQYASVLTEALAVEFEILDDQIAKVVVTTKQKITNGGIEPLEYSPKLQITFVQEDNQWLVDGAYWQKK